MIPAHHTESKMSPVMAKGVLPSGDYKEIRSIRVGSSSGARELFPRGLTSRCLRRPLPAFPCRMRPRDGFLMPRRVASTKELTSFRCRYRRHSKERLMANNKNPNEKQPGEKEPGKFHYNRATCRAKRSAQMSPNSEPTLTRNKAVASAKIKSADKSRFAEQLQGTHTLAHCTSTTSSAGTACSPFPLQSADVDRTSAMIDSAVTTRHA
jgi:hypothetical protein